MLPRVIAFVSLLCCLATAQERVLLVSVADENGAAVPGVSITLAGAPGSSCTTDAAGRCHLSAEPGPFDLIGSKPGYYQSTLRGLNVAQTDHVHVTLSHTQEVKESVEVRESPPEVDPQQVAATRSIDSTEIINIPFPVTRDIRQALPYIPGVVRDNSGQIHVAGAETYQTLTLLDGFLVSDPATGLLNARFSTDAVRAIDVQSSRYSAQYGPASGGVASFTSMSGDDRFRFSATNFIPSLQFKQGTHLDKVTPRVLFSGPINKGRAWFLLAPEGEYDNNIVSELPPGQNRNRVWRVSNLAKAQVNVTRSNILSASWLVNGLESSYSGISPLTPAETTLNEAHSSYIATVRDQIYVSGAVIEAGVAVTRHHDRALPLGTLPYTISPGIAHGNFYRSQWSDSGRVEPQLNVYLPRRRLLGAHEIRFGVVARDTTEADTTVRTPISILRSNGTLYSRIVFDNRPRWNISDTIYGGYVEDRWSPTDRLLIAIGVRADRDNALDQATASTRVAATFMISPVTKLSAGIGLFHDYPPLELLARPREGTRTQYIYDATGGSVIGEPLVTSFLAPEHPLHSPASRNWSVGIEHEFSRGLFVSADYLDRHTTHDFAYELAATSASPIQFRLGNHRTSNYRALQIAARRVFHQEHELMLAYTRSSARSSAVLDYTLDNPVYSAQSAGPLAWDAPNKIVSWGFLPVPWFQKWAFGYSAQWRTGFPFTVFNQFQQVVGLANSRRFPDFLMINPFLERRFSIKKYNLALRGGFENITGSKNPVVVQNNVASPNFGQYSVTANRAFVARIRFLGRK